MISGGEVKSAKGYALDSLGGEVTLKDGGAFTATENFAFCMRARDGYIRIEGGTVSAKEGLSTWFYPQNVVVSGGVFKGGITEEELGKRTAEGYKAVPAAGETGAYEIVIDDIYAAKDSSGNLYVTLEDAFANASDGAQITVLQDAELAAGIKVDKTVTLDLAGHTVKNNSLMEDALLSISKAGNLTVKDSSETGGGMLFGWSTLTHTNYYGDKSNVKTADMVEVFGKFTLESGTLYNEYYAGIAALHAEEGGEAVVSGGTVRCNVPSSSSMAVKSAKGSAVTVSGGRVELVEGSGAIQAEGTVTVCGDAYVECAQSTAVTMTWGRFTLKDNAVIRISDNTIYTSVKGISLGGDEAVLHMEGGTIQTPAKSSAYAIYGWNTGSTVKITGGSIDSSYAFGIRNAEISDVNAKAHTAVFYGWSDTKGGAIRVSGGTFEAPELEDSSRYTPEFNAELTGGTYKGGMAREMVKAYTAETHDVYDVENEENAYVVEPVRHYVAEVAGTQYQTLEEAFAAAQDGETVKALENIELTDRVSVDGKQITLDLNGCEVTRKAPEVLRVGADADLTVVDSSEGKTGKIADRKGGKNSSGILVSVAGKFRLESGTLEKENYGGFAALDIEEGGEAVIAGGAVNYKETKSVAAAIQVQEGGSLTVSGGAVENAEGCAIRANGVAEVNGGTVKSGGGSIVDVKGTFTLKGEGLLTAEDSRFSSGEAVNGYFGAENAVINIEGGTIKTKPGSSWTAVSSTPENSKVTVTGGTIESDYAFETWNADISNVNVKAGVAVYYYWDGRGNSNNQISGGTFEAPAFAEISGDAANFHTVLTGGTYSGGMTKEELNPYVAEGMEAKEADGVVTIGKKEVPADPKPVDPKPENPNPVNPTNPNPNPGSSASGSGGGSGRHHSSSSSDDTPAPALAPAAVPAPEAVLQTPAPAAVTAPQTAAAPVADNEDTGLMPATDEEVPLAQGFGDSDGTEQEAASEENQEPSYEELPDEAVPQSAKAERWALVNLLALLAAVMIALLGMFQKSGNGGKKIAVKAAGIVAAAAAAVTFALTENMASSMGIVDGWTLLMVLYAAIALILLKLEDIRKTMKADGGSSEK